MGFHYKQKYFLHYYNNHFRQFCFQSEFKVKEMLLFKIYKFFFHTTLSKEMGKGSNKVFFKETLVQGQNLNYFAQCF